MLMTIFVSCAPLVRVRLDQTIESLPEKPRETVLLTSERVSASGSDCVAYSVQEVYGTQQPLEMLVDYYQAELEKDGWQKLHGYSPDSDEVAAFRRNNDEYLGIYREDAISVRTTVSQLSREILLPFEDIYVLDITRTCG